MHLSRHWRWPSLAKPRVPPVNRTVWTTGLSFASLMYPPTDAIAYAPPIVIVKLFIWIGPPAKIVTVLILTAPVPASWVTSSSITVTSSESVTTTRRALPLASAAASWVIAAKVMMPLVFVADGSLAVSVPSNVSAPRHHPLSILPCRQLRCRWWAK